jgi:hypothetical protein
MLTYKLTVVKIMIGSIALGSGQVNYLNYKSNHVKTGCF